MIDFLLECNIKKDTVNALNSRLPSSTIFSLSCNEYEINKIIMYLKKIGIKCIDDILINYTDLFFNTYDEFVSIFKKYDIKKLVEFINKDYNVLSQL